MSQRYLIPTNLFYHWQDPLPPDFPEPNTGDIYFNVSSQMIRVFYEGAWHDSGVSATSSGFLTVTEGDERYVMATEMAVSTAPPPPEGPPGGAVNSVWIQY